MNALGQVCAGAVVGDVIGTQSSLDAITTLNVTDTLETALAALSSTMCFKT